MKYSILFLALGLGACASTHDRCREFDANPYGIELGENLEQQVEDLHKKLEPNTDLDQFKQKVAASTHMRWKRYGSYSACLAHMEAQDAAVYAQVGGLYGRAQNAVVTPYDPNELRRTASTPAPSAPAYGSLGQVGVCLDTCKLLENQGQCRSACYGL